MYSKKMQIEFLESAELGNRIYASVALNGGFTTRDFLTEDGETIRGNGAFFDVLVQYLIKSGIIQGVRGQVFPTATVFNLDANEDSIFTLTYGVLKGLFTLEFDEMTFEMARLSAKQFYAERYKDGKYRAKMKAQEFAHYNKSFSMFIYHEDYNNLTFENFKKLYSYLIIPSNIAIAFVGKTENLKKEDFIAMFTVVPNTEKTITYKSGLSDPYMRSDGHVIDYDQVNITYSILTFDFIESLSLTSQYMFLEFIAEDLEKEKIEKACDLSDASFIFQNDSIIGIKHSIELVFDREKFKQISSSILLKYQAYLAKYPDLVSVEIAKRKVNGIHLPLMLQELKDMSYENYLKICNQTDVIIREGQVIMMQDDQHRKNTDSEEAKQ